MNPAAMSNANALVVVDSLFNSVPQTMGASRRRGFQETAPEKRKMDGG